MGNLVFISYRRDRGYELAHLVDAELRSRGVRTFIDVSESDPGQFWPQIKAAIHSCRAFVLVCTNGSLEPRPGDDWVLREVGEAMALGRPIVPVFSQDFKRPEGLLPLLTRATEYTGVSMDTQFHVAAFDHLSQLVGGRKRSEQRRRMAFLAGLSSLILLAALALGGREIIVLREALKSADVRSEEISKSVIGFEKTQSDIRQATEERERLAKDAAEKRERDLMATERSAATARQVEDEQRQWREKASAQLQAEDEEEHCTTRCREKRWRCEADSDNKESCGGPFAQCEDDCVDALHRVCSGCMAVK